MTNEEKFKEAALNEAEAKKIMQVKEAEAEMESKIFICSTLATKWSCYKETYKNCN